MAARNSTTTPHSISSKSLAAENAKYRGLFVQFNEKYFGGKLPRYRVMVVDQITRGGQCGMHFKKNRIIKLVRMSEEEMTETLLHEMVHARVGDSHRERFCAEMDRLERIGAPVLKGEGEQWREVGRIKINKAYLRAIAQDAFVDAHAQEITLTLSRFCHYVARQHGEWSTAAFVRRYPFIKSVFKEARKERQELKRLREFKKKIRPAGLRPALWFSKGDGMEKGADGMTLEIPPRPQPASRSYAEAGATTHATAAPETGSNTWSKLVKKCFTSLAA